MPGEGNSLFILEQLIVRDFKIRYRNMSLGILWSLLNPLVMVGAYSFVAANVFRNFSIPHYPLFVLCGVICFNYFSLSWIHATHSVTSSASLLKRLSLTREIIPVSTVLANGIHFLLQFGLMLVFTLASGIAITRSWLWLPLVLALLLLSVTGLALLFSAADVYVRDTRYVVESVCLILFWLTPVFYSETMVPAKYRTLYLLNPAASAIVAMRQIVLDHRAPDLDVLLFALLSTTALLITGLFVFNELKSRFGDHL